MTRFHSQESVDAPLDQVVRWHSLPGAVTRLSPHWAQTVVREGDPSAPGTRTHMKIAAPGSRGAIRVPWVSEHFALDDADIAPLTAPVELTAPTSTAHGFGDRMVESPRAPMRSWEHRHVFRADPSRTPGASRSPAPEAAAAPSPATLIDDAVDLELPRLPGRLARVPGAGLPESVTLRTLKRTFAARTTRLTSDLAFLRSIDAPTTGGSRPLRILIAGASGLVGTQLTALLTTAGHTVRRLVRHEPAAAQSPTDPEAPPTAPLSATGEVPDQDSHWDPRAGLLLRDDLAWADVVVNLAGRSIGGRLTDTAKEEILTSRIETTRLLVTTIAALPPEDRPEAFLCASAVGLYGTDRRNPATEAAPTGDGFLAEVCRAWEDEAAAVEAAGVRRVSVRTGLVLSGLGGLLALQVPLYLAGAGGRLGSGDQWFPWISHDDLVRVYARAIVDASLTGPVNAVAPGIVRQREFAKVMGKHLRRPAIVPVPRLGPALLLGGDGADELALAGQNVVPAALDAAGFAFAHPDLADCLVEELGP